MSDPVVGALLLQEEWIDRRLRHLAVSHRRELCASNAVRDTYAFRKVGVFPHQLSKDPYTLVTADTTSDVLTCFQRGETHRVYGDFRDTGTDALIQSGESISISIAVPIMAVVVVRDGDGRAATPLILRTCVSHFV
jgi:hypothetical protein